MISPDGTRIAFWAIRDGNSDIYTIRVDGTDLVRVTSDTLAEAFPTWSPDGARIAFSRSANSFTPLMGVFIVNADGSNEQRVPGLAASPELAWSPDAVELAFTGLRSVRLDGSNERTISTRAGAKGDPAWAPDGSRLAYGCVDVASGSQEICAVNRDGSVDAFITQSAPPSGEIQPTWSPDGAYLAFAGRRGPASSNNIEIVVKELSTGAEHIVAPIGADDTHPSWGP